MEVASLEESTRAPNLGWERAFGCQRRRVLEDLVVDSACFRVQAQALIRLQSTQVVGGVGFGAVREMRSRPSFVVVD